jgi:hypothetical protein
MTHAGMILLLALSPATGPVATPGPSDEVEAPEVLTQAEHAFTEGANHRNDADAARPWFREAARGYDQLWHRGFRNPALALNRARAHRLAGNLPASIAAFHDGLAITRYDRPLQAGLEDARAAVLYPLDGDLATRCRQKAATTIGTRMSPVEAYIVAGVGWILAWVGLVRFVTTRLPWYLLFAGVWLVALGILGGLWVQDERRQSRETAHPLVIVTHETQLRKGNGVSYPPRLDARLPMGVEARERTRRGGWMQVELAGGDIGWLPESALLQMVGD